MNPIEAENLVKAYPQPDGGVKEAVGGISFHVLSGEIYGLLGPNGAGKTTTLRMLAGLLTPTDGVARICGHDVQQDPMEVRRHIGFLTASTGLYTRLSARELLVYFAQLHGMDRDAAERRAEDLIAQFDMKPFAHQRCGTLSTGQKQRTNIARALVADAPVLILDEPTLGLDVLSNRVILDFITDQRDAGKAIVLSTHYLDEAETMCDRIGLVHGGRLMAEGTLSELVALSGEQRLSAIFLKLFHAADATAAAGGGAP